MKPWYRTPCDWQRSPAMDQIRARLGRQASNAWTLFFSVCSWCAEQDNPVITRAGLEREAEPWRLGQRLLQRIVDTFLAVGLLEEAGENSYQIDPAIIRRPEGAGAQAREGEAQPQPRGGRSRQGRYRQEHAEEVKAKDRARKASRKARAGVTERSDSVTPTVTESVTERHGTASRNVTESVTDSVTPTASTVTESDRSATFRDTPAPPDPPPTPAQAHAHAQAHEGRASAPAMGESLGEEKPEPKASKPDAVAPKAPKPKAKRALPTRSNLAQAYAAGISAATGAPYSPPSKTWDRADLDAAAATHGAGRVGAELLGWLEGEARTFARVANPFVAGRGYRVDDFGSWLNSGRLGAPRPAPLELPPQPRPGPIDRGPRSAPTSPPAVIPEGAGAVEIVAALGLFAPKTRTVEELEAAIRDEIDRQTPRPASPRRPLSVVRTPEQIAEARVRALAQLEAARRQYETAHPEEAEAAL